MLSQLDFKIFGLDTVKDQYVDDADFKDAFGHCINGKPWGKFHIQDGFLFRANKLCVPASSVRLLLLQEAHGGGLMGHFGVYKTHEVLAAHFFWPRMRADVERLVARCTTCQKAKSRFNNHKNVIPPLLSSRQSQNKIHRNILPRCTRNRKRQIKTMGVKSGLSFVALVQRET